jgi:cytochrome b561
MNHRDYSYPTYAKIIHLGIALFGITAYLTAEFAEDGNTTLGYMLHAYLGLSLAFFIGIRVITGFTNTGETSFKGWSPFSKAQLKLTLSDFRSLSTLTVPEHDRHQGLAGLTQAFGLIVFFWMSATGTVLFILGGGIETKAFKLIEELHEVGETLIPLYLLLHIGAVVVHSLTGKPIWQKMFSSK